MAMARASLHSFGHLPLPRSGPAWRSGIGSLQSGPSHFNAGPSQRTYATAARKRQEKWNAKTKEEQMEQYMNMMERVNMPGTMDLSNQRMEVLDLAMPATFSQIPKGNLAKGTINWLKESTRSKLYNAFHLQTLAASPTFLGLPDVERPPSKWSPQIFRTQSVEESSWLTPLRQHALERYVLMNEAQSRGDLKTVRLTCSDHFLREALQRINSRSKSLSYAWSFHGEKSPTQCLSIRTAMADDNANVLTAQALIKFDTLQSLSVYNKNTGKLVQTHGTPEEPSNVVEYMILEKRMAYDGPWMLRGQLFEGVKPKLENLF